MPKSLQKTICKHTWLVSILQIPLQTPQSDSEYNPVEEPSWLQQDSLQATHFSYHLDSPPTTPKIKAHKARDSRAVDSPLARAKGPRNQPERALQQNPADNSLDDIMSFVKEKVRARFLLPWLPSSSASGCSKDKARLYNCGRKL